MGKRGDNGGVGNSGYGEGSGFDVVGAEPMTGHVDDVVDAAENAVVAVGGKNGAIGGVVRPVAPIFTLWVFAVLLIVLSDEALRIAPNRLHDARPGISNTNISGSVGAGFDFLSVLVPDHRIDSERRRPSATWFHRI